MSKFDITRLPDAWEYERLNDAKFAESWFQNTVFSNLIGGSEAIIDLKNVPKHGGVVVTWQKRLHKPFKVVTGDNQVMGNEELLRYVMDDLKMELNTIADMESNTYYVQQAYKHDFIGDLKKAILTERSIRSKRRFIQELLYSIIPNERRIINPVHLLTNPAITTLVNKIQNVALVNRFDRNPATINQFSWSRIMFGLDKNLDATTIATGCDGTDGGGANRLDINHGDGLTIEGIRRLVDLAILGSRREQEISEDAIKPRIPGDDKYNIQMYDYILLTPPEAYNQLATDDPFFYTQFNRGMRENDRQPTILRGADYKGGVEGVDLVVDRELSRFIFSRGDGDQQRFYAINFLLGAQALGYALGTSELVPRIDDYKKIYGLGHHEFMDLKAIQYPSNTELNSSLKVPNGIYIWITQLGKKAAPAPHPRAMINTNDLNAVSSNIDSSVTNLNKK